MVSLLKSEKIMSRRSPARIIGSNKMKGGLTNGRSSKVGRNGAEELHG